MHVEGKYMNPTDRKKISFRASKQPRKFGTQKIVENYKKIAKMEIILSQWNRWVATYTHLDQSFPLSKKWYPLR